MSILSEQAPLDDLPIALTQQHDVLISQPTMYLLIAMERVSINGHEGFVVVIRRDAIDRELAAVLTAMDDHQLTLIETRVLLAPALERQADRFHARLAGGEAIARRVQIEMA